MQRDVTESKMPHRLLKQIELMKATVLSRLLMSQGNYNLDLYKNVLDGQKIKSGDCVYIYRPQLAALRQMLPVKQRVPDTLMCYNKCLDCTEYSDFICIQ